ncbi:uncharacterized protein LOC143577833 [Bidens hawaiensis]|uniref:uncharacterized protein LOC143577833 n=1 Tax=Bidens hawaiensis TaxID=980011 RepID=UPI00404A486F
MDNGVDVDAPLEPMTGDSGRKYGTCDPNNKSRFICDFCEKPTTGGVYRLKQHLVGGFTNVLKCMKCPLHVRQEIRDYMLKKARAKEVMNPLEGDYVFDDEEEECVITNRKRASGSVQENVPKKQKPINTFFKPEDTLKGRKGGKKQTLNEVCKKELRENACREINKWFCDARIAFHAATYDSFQTMFNAVLQYGLGFKEPSMYELSVPLLRKEVEEINMQIDEHKKEWASKGCSILSDGWRDSTVQKDIVNFLVNSPKGSVFMKSIDVSEITKDAHTLARMLEQMVDQVGKKNVVQVVTDNASNYVKAGKYVLFSRLLCYICIILIFYIFSY